MTIDISTFRSVANDFGYIRANGQDDVRLRGTGFFGGISKIFQSYKATENKGVRDQFLSTLKNTYGPEFTNSPAVQRLLNPAANTTLLSANVVRDLLALGDNALQEQEKKKNDELLANVKLKIHAPAPKASASENQKTIEIQSGSHKAIQVTSSYANQAELQASAQRFIQTTQLSQAGSGLLNAVTAHLNNQNDMSFASLKGMPGHEAALGFLHAFTLTPAMISIQGQMDNIQTRNIQTGTLLIDATAGVLQTSTRTSFLAAELAKAKNPTEAGHKAKEILDVTASQIKKTESALNAIANRANFSTTLTLDNAKKLEILRSGLEGQLQSLRDPNGIFQSFRAFAGEVAMNPDEGYHTIQQMLQGT
jgi:hypothetical protein